MTCLIGTDEAGYGPNLGPLVISASVWEVPDGIGGEELYEHLADVITASPTRKKGDRHLLCDDHASMVPAEGPFRQKVPVPFSPFEEREESLPIRSRIDRHAAATRLNPRARGRRT